MVLHNKWPAVVSGMLLLGLSGCVSTMPPGIEQAGASDGTSPYSRASDEAPRDLLNYSGGERESEIEEDMVAKAVRSAGRRLGATAGFRQQADHLYLGIEAYEQYLTEIFDFGELMLPEGIVPPVLAQTEDYISFDQTNGRETKEIRAQVLTTVSDATFANSGGPHWRDYLRLTQPPLDKPHPELQSEINANRAAWQRGVKEGYDKGIEQANQAFDIAINQLSRDYSGMQLFRLLWVAGQVEAPEIVEQTQDIVGGGRGNSEMSIGVRRVVISEPVYFINDASEWTALISASMNQADDVSAGLSDIVEKVDNTQYPQGTADVPDLSKVR